MVRFFTALILTSALALCVTHVSAATEQSVSVKFRVFGIGNDDFKELFILNGKQFTKLEFKRTSRSATTYHYQGAPNLNLYTPNPAHSQTSLNEPPYLHVSSIRIDASLDDALLILAADESNRDTPKHLRSYQGFMLDDSLNGFPNNSLIFLNITGVALYGKIADEQIELSSGHSEPISFENNSGSERGIPIAFAVQSNRGPQLVMSNNIRLAKNRRSILILQPPRRANSTRIVIRLLTEAIQTEDPAKN